MFEEVKSFINEITYKEQNLQRIIKKKDELKNKIKNGTVRDVRLETTEGTVYSAIENLSQKKKNEIAHFIVEKTNEEIKGKEEEINKMKSNITINFEDIN